MQQGVKEEKKNGVVLALEEDNLPFEPIMDLEGLLQEEEKLDHVLQ